MEFPGFQHTHTKKNPKNKRRKSGGWINILTTHKKLKLSVDQAAYRQVRLADRAGLFDTNRDVAEIKNNLSLSIFFLEFFLRIDIFWQLSALS